MVRIDFGAPVVLMLFCSLPATAIAIERSETNIENIENFDCDQLSRVRADAERGDAKAQFTLAKFYASGHCVPQSLAEGAKLIHDSADSGYAPAQAFLGFSYEKEGQSDSAAKLARLAADQGDPRGQFLLAYLYEHGRGVAENDVEAAKWATRSAEQGDGIAQGMLARMYHDGLGVNKDDIEADKWLILESRTTDADNELNMARKLIELNMSQERILEAQRRADQWKPTSQVKPLH
jgi:TPR repeat protein